jgi:hypothetical protein
MDATANLALQQKGWAAYVSDGEPCSGPISFWERSEILIRIGSFSALGMGPRVKPEDD